MIANFKKCMNGIILNNFDYYIFLLFIYYDLLVSIMLLLTIFSNVLKMIFLLLYISVVVDLRFQSTYILFFLLICFNSSFVIHFSFLSLRLLYHLVVLGICVNLDLDNAFIKI